jgi:hypothetical protein
MECGSVGEAVTLGVIHNIDKGLIAALIVSGLLVTLPLAKFIRACDATG